MSPKRGIIFTSNPFLGNNKSEASLKELNMNESHKSLIETVKFNCDVSDAKYWGFYSICGLLMSLRALYISNKGLKPWEHIDQADISKWISQKEDNWEEIEGESFKELEIDGKMYDHFDVDGINGVLNSEGLVYGAGYGVFKKPSFFLADLYLRNEMYGYTVYSVKREYVRDLFISPGLLQGKQIFLRLEPLRALLWDKFLESKAKNNPLLEYAFSQYGFNGDQIVDQEFERKFEELTDRYSGVVLYHEIGEVMEEFPGWAEMIYGADSKGTEFFLRAIKDMLADTSGHGPLKRSINNKDEANLGLCIALLDRYKAKLHLPIRNAFEKFIQDGDWLPVDEARKEVYARLALLRDELVDAYMNKKEKDDLLNKILELKSRFNY